LFEGTTIADRFAIESEVGAGGMGTVYRAIDRARGVPVAVKVLARQDATDVVRFEREIALLAELSDPGIVGYVAHGQLAGDRLYFVMEWIDGATLGDFIAGVGATVAESVEVIRLVASALAHAHARGILHRDLKPSNVMLVDGDIARPKLIDFGLARRLREVSNLTGSGSTIGTPGYMSPEQVRGERDLDGRADVFALGCLLYECLAGRPAFGTGNWLIVQSRILLATPPPLLDAPEQVAVIVDEMLAKEPAKRLESAAVVAERLAALPALGSTPRRHARGVRYDATLREVPAWRFPAESECYVVGIVDNPPQEIEERIAPLGGVLARIDEGALVIRFAPTAGEPALARADQCAQLLRSLAPDAPIAIAQTAKVLEKATRYVIAAELAAVFGRRAPPIRVL
jgi:serine/threonine protein kinase